MSEEPEYVCSATLIILGDNLNPKEVTERLGLEPHQSWRKGERKSFVRSDGTVEYFDSVYEWGGWKCFITDERKDSELSEQLAWWCDLLEGREALMHELEEAGCLVQMNCFVAAESSAEVIVSADLQRCLSSLHLELAISFSPDSPSI